MKKRTLIIIIIIVAALVLVKIFLLPSENSGPPQGAQQKSQTAMATGFVVSSQLLENSISSSGTVLANEEVELRPETAGKLISIGFKEGSIVQKGALLVKIYDTDLQAQLKKLNLQYKLAQEREGRLKGLLGINGVSQEEYDISSNDLQTISADMDYTKAQISKTEIYAPFKGKIGLKNVSEGNFVNNSNVIATIQQTDLLKVDFTIPEKYAALVVPGDTIKFTVEGIREKLVARVSAIEPKIDAETRNIMIRAIYDNAKGNVYPGAFAKVELITKQQAALMIPTEAVIPELKGKKVFIVKNGKAKPVKVETGVRTDTQIEITNGLTAGDTVVITGIMGIKPDMNVKIMQLKK